MVDRGIQRIEPIEVAEEEWVEHTNEVAEETLMTEAQLWYRGANIPVISRIFLPYPSGLDEYREICEEVVGNDYEGFTTA